MLLKKLTLNNFMPFKGQHEITFDEGVFGVIGEYESDPVRSNRAGKSTFFESISFALYGETRAKQEAEVIHYGEDECSVELILETDDGSDLIVKRSRNKKSGELVVSNQEGVKKRNAQQYINDTIGLDYAGFLLTSYFKQNDILTFLQAGSTEKKQILMRWLNLTNWEVYEDRAKEYRNQVLSYLDSLEAKRSVLDKPFDPNALLERKNELDKSKAQAEILLDELHKQKTSLEIELHKVEDVSAHKSRIAEISRRVFELRDKRPNSVSFKSRIAQIDEFLSKVALVTTEKHNQIVVKRDQLTLKIGEYKHRINQAERDKNTAISKMTGVCPILKEACSRIEVTEEYVAKLNSDADKLYEEVSSYEENRAKADKWIDLYKKQQNLLAEKKDLLQQIGMSAQIEEQIASLETERDQLTGILKKKSQDDKVRVIGELSLVKSDIEKTGLILHSISKEFGQIQEAYKIGKYNQDKLKDLLNEIAETQQSLGNAEYVVGMFSKTGIPSLEIENSFKSIEDEINFVLVKLKVPYTVELSATRDASATTESFCPACKAKFPKGSSVCSCGAKRERKKIDELNFKVFENGNELPWYSDSGGGQVLLSLAIRIALTRLAQKKSGVTWSALFLDEVLANLDSANRAAVINLIMNTLHHDLGFRQIFMVSHTPEVQQSSMAKLLRICKKDDGTSSVAWV